MLVRYGLEGYEVEAECRPENGCNPASNGVFLVYENGNIERAVEQTVTVKDPPPSILKTLKGLPEIVKVAGCLTIGYALAQK